MSLKAQRDLLLGSKKKTGAEKQQKIKHDPIQEFRDSMYFSRDLSPDAAEVFPKMAIKRAMRTIAVEIDGVQGTQIDRLIYMPDEYIRLIGTPTLRIDVARLSGSGTLRTCGSRSDRPTWATQFVRHALHPQFSQATIQALLANAGQFIGIGDNRQERGKGSFGTFVVTEGLPDGLSVKGNKKRQIDAYENPTVDTLHVDTSALFELSGEEVRQRA